jgi:hypothetical protein
MPEIRALRAIPESVSAKSRLPLPSSIGDDPATNAFRTFCQGDDPMKSVKVLALAAAAALAASAAFAAGLPDLKGRTIVAVTENAYTPLNFADPKTGQGIGWEYDAVNEIAKRLNAKVDWKLSSWDTMIQAVREGQFDIGMDGITINDERKAQVDFSDPYMVSEQFMLVRGDESRFTDAKTFADNKDLLVGAQAGTTNFYVAVYNVLDGDDGTALEVGQFCRNGRRRGDGDQARKGENPEFLHEGTGLQLALRPICSRGRGA